MSRIVRYGFFENYAQKEWTFQSVNSGHSLDENSSLLKSFFSMILRIVPS